MIRREFAYYATTLVLVLFVFYKVLAPDDPRFPNMPDVAITAPRGRTVPINIWLAPHGPDCKPVDGWKLAATAKFGTAKIVHIEGVIANSAYESCNGRSIEGARLDYTGSVWWFRSYDYITVEMLSANAVVWRVRYDVALDDPRLANVSDMNVIVPRGQTTPVNVWLATYGPDCKPVDGWKLLATAKYGTAKIERADGVIANSAYESCNGRSIEGARLDYIGSAWWFRSYDEITVAMLTANAVVWRLRYKVAFGS